MLSKILHSDLKDESLEQGFLLDIKMRYDVLDELPYESSDMAMAVLRLPSPL
jgi:hypothetical protein